MAHGIFIHRADSIYDDVPSERYQFPRQYLKRAQACVGDWIVYYEPRKVARTRGYFAVARVQEVLPDPRVSGMFLAVIEAGSYLDFGTHVAFRDHDGLVERGLTNDAGNVSARAQWSVRPLSREDFRRIVGLGLWGDDDKYPLAEDGLPTPGFEDPLASFFFDDERERVETLGSRVVRDRNFRKIVLTAYGKRCAVTGLRLINGGGRAEVQAAHIRPVEENGPDLVSNGLALSATVHWTFDRGLIGVGKNLEVLVSRQVNDPKALSAMINETGRLLVPKRAAFRPHPQFLQWHMEKRFKH